MLEATLTVNPRSEPSPFFWNGIGGGGGVGGGELQSANDGQPFLQSANDGNPFVETAND
jgi:hypothetical protein